MVDRSARKNDARPVGESVLTDWGEGTWHGGKSELYYGDRQQLEALGLERPLSML